MSDYYRTTPRKASSTRTSIDRSIDLSCPLSHSLVSLIWLKIKEEEEKTNCSFYYQVLVVVLHRIVSITSCAIKKTRKE